jgi:AcrR family transcriptional regulator
MKEVALGTPRPNRFNRKKERTRDRLINAAISVVASKGPDAAAINDITEKADVGFGTFYNYFESKDAILAAAVEELFDRINGHVDRPIEAIADPLEKAITGIRLFVRILIAMPVWQDFILRICTVPGFENALLFPRLFSGLRKSEAAGRLRIADSVVTTYSVGGVLIFLCMALRDGKLRPEDAPATMASMALRVLGVAEDEIASLVASPMPELSPDEFENW